MTSRPRPSYTEVFQPIFSDVGDSDSEAGSIFDPAVGVEYAAESPSDGFKSRKQGTKPAATVDASTSTPGIQNLLSVSRPHRSGVSVAPNLPSKDHRHRPHGLWAPPSDVYRLLSPPTPFSESKVIRTYSADHPAVMQRVKKAWANIYGTGPVWELLEDRAFFKEEWTGYDLSSRKGRKLRPVVFPTVRAQEPQFLSREYVRSAVALFKWSYSLLLYQICFSIPPPQQA